MQKNRGFTLLEVLIYAALVALIIGGISYTLFTLITTSKIANDKVVVEEEANFILKKFDWVLAGYQTINSPASGSSGATLSVNKFNFLPNPIVFDVSSGNLRITKGLLPSVTLNSSRITVSNPVFTHIAANGSGPDAVKAAFDINGRTYQITVYKKQ